MCAQALPWRTGYRNGDGSGFRGGGFGGDFRERAGRKRGEDPILDAPERVADVAFRELLAVVVVRRAGGDGQGPLNRLDDIGDRNRRRGSRQRVAATRPLVRRQQAAARELLQ